MKNLCRLLALTAFPFVLLACASEPTAPETSAVSTELGAGGRPVGKVWSRSPVYGGQGMAATAHPHASLVAIDILKEGGSAVDAAIAANAALGLMEPTGNGIGGDIFVIVWDPETRQLYGYNGSGRSPRGQSLDQLREHIDALKSRGELPEDYRGIPRYGPLPLSVPGAVDGWFAIHEKFGRIPMNQVLAPTVDYAREGFPVPPGIAHAFGRNWSRFQENLAGSPHLDNIRDYRPNRFKPGITAPNRPPSREKASPRAENRPLPPGWDAPLRAPFAP